MTIKQKFEVRAKNDESERIKTKRIIEAIEEIKHEKLSRSVMEINGSMINTEIVVGEKDIGRVIQKVSVRQIEE